MFQNLKRRCRDEPTPLMTIYLEEAARYPDAAPHLLYESIVSSMRTWRRTNQPSVPRTLTQLADALQNHAQYSSHFIGMVEAGGGQAVLLSAPGASRRRGGTTTYSCTAAACRASFNVHDDVLGPVRGEHDHEEEPWIPNRNQMFQNLKRRCRDEPTPLMTIYLEEAARYPDAAPHLLYESKVSSMRTWRRTNQPSVPRTLTQLADALQNHAQYSSHFIGMVEAGGDQAVLLGAPGFQELLSASDIITDQPNKTALTRGGTLKLATIFFADSAPRDKRSSHHPIRGDGRELKNLRIHPTLHGDPASRAARALTICSRQPTPPAHSELQPRQLSLHGARSETVSASYHVAPAALSHQATLSLAAASIPAAPTTRRPTTSDYACRASPPQHRRPTSRSAAPRTVPAPAMDHTCTLCGYATRSGHMMRHQISKHRGLMVESGRRAFEKYGFFETYTPAKKYCPQKYLPPKWLVNAVTGTDREWLEALYTGAIQGEEE
ncbi:uncharacterized protein LOC125236106 [Leguminivora glycinivorella]|uniref:uncharacterized protein LOC125236106 n=1 Tax=Leguminivora glycinivorella TaxID=1035111 RepID=UPI00200CCAEC|nr:uncharacterized protein LOC125236106 [Leguminivora glycinivorella]